MGCVNYRPFTLWRSARCLSDNGQLLDYGASHQLRLPEGFKIQLPKKRSEVVDSFNRLLKKSESSLPVETKARLHVSETMRGPDTQQSSMFSYLSPEERVPAKHPLRPIRLMVDEALKALSPAFSRLYSAFGRPSIPPEKLLRALLLQVLYTVRSERMLMEQLEYNLLFRWFVGLNMDEAVWVPTVFTRIGTGFWKVISPRSSSNWC